MPRIGEAFEGIEEIAYLPGLQYYRLIGAVRTFARPRVRKALEALMKAGEEVERWGQHHQDFVERMAARGFPLGYISTSISPYDFIADYFRGATGMMKDPFRNKDKLLALLDKAATFLIRQASQAFKASGRGCYSPRRSR